MNSRSGCLVFVKQLNEQFNYFTASVMQGWCSSEMSDAEL